MVLLLVSCTLKRPQDEARSQLTTPHYVQSHTMTDKLPSLAACLGTFLLQPPVTSFVLFIHIFQFLRTLEFLCLFMYFRNIWTVHNYRPAVAHGNVITSDLYLIDYILTRSLFQALTSSWSPSSFVPCTLQALRTCDPRRWPVTPAPWKSPVRLEEAGTLWPYPDFLWRKMDRGGGGGIT